MIYTYEKVRTVTNDAKKTSPHSSQPWWSLFAVIITMDHAEKLETQHWKIEYVVY
jgi:hypothetical protein